MDDNSFRNVTFAEVSGLSTDRILREELRLLDGLAFDLHVDAPTWRDWVLACRDRIRAHPAYLKDERVGRILHDLVRRAVHSAALEEQPFAS